MCVCVFSASVCQVYQYKNRLDTNGYHLMHALAKYITIKFICVVRAAGTSSLCTKRNMGEKKQQQIQSFLNYHDNPTT